MSRIVALATVLGPMAGTASAATMVFTGYDIGSGSLAASPNAVAAAAAFDAAAGSVALTDFESAPTAFTVTGFTAQPSCPASLCGYNTTVGGSNFLRGSRSFTFTFTNAISAFGAFFTGWQIGTQTITYTDGTTEVLSMGTADLDLGGTRFFGFIAAGKSIASLVYNTCGSPGCDVVGIDDVRTSVAPVPLPAGLPLLAVALAGLGLVRRSRRQA